LVAGDSVEVVGYSGAARAAVGEEDYWPFEMTEEGGYLPEAVKAVVAQEDY